MIACFGITISIRGRVESRLIDLTIKTKFSRKEYLVKPEFKVESFGGDGNVL